MMMTMMSCLSVCNVGILWTNGRLISVTAVLSSYLSTRECMCSTVFASSASRGTKQRRQLYFQFALLVYEFTTSVRL